MSDLQSLDPTRTAVLVMDYQSGILDRVRDASSLLARAGAVVEAARRGGVLIGYVRVAVTAEEAAAAPAHSRFAHMGAAFAPDAPGTQVHDAVAPRPGDVVVRKHRTGAFSTTDLHEQLQRRGVDTVVLAGISTSGVVLSTVRDAADRDYRVLVLSDACADPEPDVHAFLLEHILGRQAEVLTSDQLLSRLPQT